MRWYRRRGQSLVEFALIIPVLLAIFFFIIDGAFIIQGLLTVNHAARAAARMAVTYQPPLGECFDHYTGGIKDNGYPWCGGGNESDPQYYTRRVEIIKRIAREEARGLRIYQECDTDACMAQDTPGMFGVKVWGIHDFDDPVSLQDMPGLPGLPVQVQVVHRVPLITFAIFMADPSFLVQGTVQMVNEGVQVGQGNEPPPIIPPPPPVEPPDDPPPTTDAPPTDEPTDEPTTPLPPILVELDFESATNLLPSQREHLMMAHVTREGQPAAGVPVRFSTDNGSFDFSGYEVFQVKFVETDGNGNAYITIYANEPMVANIEAWVDEGEIGVKESSEVDTATKIWQVEGPYLTVSNHNPVPGEIIGVWLKDHDPALNPYDVWWCPSSSDPANTAQITALLGDDVSVDAGLWEFELSSVEVPTGTFGSYHIESHSANGGCGAAGDLVASSATILIREADPDLTITDVQILGPPEAVRAPEVPMTVTVTVANLEPVTVDTGPFDVDVYPNLDSETGPYPMQLSAAKQWIETLGPNETTVLTFVVEIDDVGTNKLWAQVDTTNYVEEEDEENNVFGPLEFETCYGSDDFDNGLKAFWSTEEFGDADASYSINGNGELSIMNRSSSGLWSGSHNFYYIYQSYAGDFDARLRIFQKPDAAEFSKIGLHVREKLQRKSNYAMNMATNAENPAASQMAYNNGTRLEDDRAINLPYWTRIVRKGNQYTFYSTEVAYPKAGDWRNAGTVTINDPLPYIGVAHANYDNWPATEGIVDDFIICPAEIAEGGDEVNEPPPGLIECEELLYVRSFEGNRDTVFTYWNAGEAGAYRHTSEERYRGNFSIRLHVSLGSYPCDDSVLQPHLYQDIQIPSTVYSVSTLTVSGYYFVAGSNLECSNPDSPDPNDQLTLDLLTLDGDPLLPQAQDVVNGGVISQTWHDISVPVGDSINLQDHAGETVRLYWSADNPGDYNGTFFYVDDVSAQMCTMWPIPEEITGTVSLGGKLTTRASSGNIRVPLIGADVWAYTQSGDIYHTTSIHDGTYHFYNLPQPGMYIVYSEAVVDGQLRSAVANVTLDAGDRNYNVNLFLQ